MLGRPDRWVAHGIAASFACQIQLRNKSRREILWRTCGGGQFCALKPMFCHHSQVDFLTSFEKFSCLGMTLADRNDILMAHKGTMFSCSILFWHSSLSPLFWYTSVVQFFNCNCLRLLFLSAHVRLAMACLRREHRREIRVEIYIFQAANQVGTF